MSENLRITDIALEGFRLTREQPRALIVWAGLQFLISSLIAAVLIVAVSPADLAAYQAIIGNPASDPVAASALFQRMAPVVLPLGLLALAANAVLTTALLRAVLRPAEDGPLGYLRLSMDEVRQVAVSLLGALLLVTLMFGVTFVVAILLSLSGGTSGAAMGPVAVLLPPLVIAVALYPGVRLSLAPAMTFADRRISLFRAWPLTEGRFWPMLAAYLLALGLAFVVWLLGVSLIGFISVAIGLALGMGLQGVQRALHPDLSSLARYFGGFMLLTQACGAVFQVAAGVIATAPAPAAFRALAGRVGAK